MLKCKCLCAALLIATIGVAAGFTYANVAGYFSREAAEQATSTGSCSTSSCQEAVSTCPSTSETSTCPSCPLSSGEQD
jgi:hypothetical protein